MKNNFLELLIQTCMVDQFRKEMKVFEEKEVGITNAIKYGDFTLMIVRILNRNVEPKIFEIEFRCK